MIDEHGFTRRSYDDILQEIIAQAQNTIDPEISVGPDSVFGTLIRLMASQLATQEEDQEQAYHSGFVSQAEGVSLDRLAANIGLRRNPAANAYVTLTLNGVANTRVPAGTRFSTEDGKQFFTIDDAQIIGNGVIGDDKQEQGTVDVHAVSVEQKDECNVAPGQITVLLEAIDGLKSVTNHDEATGGASAEQDLEFRERLLLNYQKAANGTVNSLITSVENVTGVKLVQVLVNDTMEVDKYGNEPKSVHFYVQGGTDEDVANAIFNAIVAGVSTNGQVNVEVPVVGGNRTQLIKFDRPMPVVVNVSVHLIVDDNFGIDGPEKAKEAITKYLNSLTIGETLYFNKLIGVLYTVDGVVDLTWRVDRDGVQLEGNKLVPKEFEHIVPGKVGVTYAN